MRRTISVGELADLPILDHALPPAVESCPAGLTGLAWGAWIQPDTKMEDWVQMVRHSPKTAPNPASGPSTSYRLRGNPRSTWLSAGSGQREVTTFAFV